MSFEWNARKAEGNRRKHGVTFQEATTIFADTLALTFNDLDHSTLEQRFLTMGLSANGRLLVVAHAARGDNIRIISARVMTPRERKQYEQHEQG